MKELLVSLDEPKSVCVVKLATTAWADRRGLHTKKSLTFLRRKCIGFNVLEEDAGVIGADDVLRSVLNLNKCVDGIYEVVVCNETHDWETGYVDGYDLKLVPFVGG